MQFYEWTADLNLGIDVIDAQHKQIVNYINKLSSAITANDADQVFLTIEQLRDYCLDHFSFEEQLMQQAGYILCAAHQAIHRRFEERIINVQADLESGKDPFSVARRVRTWLMTWLIQHIHHEDVDYVPYVKKILKKEQSWISSTLKKVFGDTPSGKATSP